jgi:hypothetical protein
MSVTGFPYSTGDVLTAVDMNSLTQFSVQTKTADYTATTNDQYQNLFVMNSASAIAFKLPTDATYDFPIGTTFTIINKNAGVCTVSAVTSGTTTLVSGGAVSAAPTIAQWKSAAVVKIAANSWIAVGGVA